MTQPHLHEHRLLKPVWTVLSVSTLVTLPWQVCLVIVTVVWLGLWRLVLMVPGVAAGLVGLRRATQPLAREVFLKESQHAYLSTVFGIGLYTPMLFAVSIWYQVSVCGVGSGGSLDLVALFVTHALWLGPNHLFFAHVTTLLHQLGHQKRFARPKWSFLETYTGYVLGSLYGHVPENFAMGHNRIHHKYDNGPEDITSTLDIDRASLRGWLQYHARFILYWSGLGVADFFRVRGKMTEARRQWRGMLFYYGIGAVGCVVNWQIALAYWLLPHFMIINFLSAINFTWHAFVDPDNAHSNYGNSFTIVDAEQDVWDEAYHVSHHEHSSAPWDEMRDHFETHRDQYVAQRSLVMAKTQVFEIFFHLVTGNLHGLAKRVVLLDGDLPQEEIVAMLRERTRPIDVPLAQ